MERHAHHAVYHWAELVRYVIDIVDIKWAGFGYYRRFVLISNE